MTRPLTLGLIPPDAIALDAHEAPAGNGPGRRDPLYETRKRPRETLGDSCPDRASPVFVVGRPP